MPKIYLLNVMIILLLLVGFPSPVECSVTGTQRVLVIPVEFSESPHQTSITNLQSWMENEVADYFSEVSMGQLDLDVQMIADWVPLGPRSSYMLGSPEFLDDVGLAIDAMYAADDHCIDQPEDGPGGAPINWAQYSQDEGLSSDTYPVVVIVYGGNAISRDVSLSLGSGWWWPEGYRYPVPQDMNDRSPDWRVGVTIVSETTICDFDEDSSSIIYESTKGIYAHEITHSFAGPFLTNAEAASRGIDGGRTGIPDLYDEYANFDELGLAGLTEDFSDDFTSSWALMGTGCWNPMPPRTVQSRDLCTGFILDHVGQFPSYPTSYTQIRLGWLDESDASEVYIIDPPEPGDGAVSESVVIHPLEDMPSACPAPSGISCTRALKIPIDDNDEIYYLVEVRKFAGSDEGLTEEGVIITAVDEGRSSGDGIVRVVDSTPGVPVSACSDRYALNPMDDAAFGAGEYYEAPDIPGLVISVESRFDDGSYLVNVDYPEPLLPDVSISDWEPPVYATTDIWIDSDCANEFGILSESGVGNRDPLCFGRTNKLYAHVTNLEDVDAHGVVARFYWAPFGAGQRDDWTFIDQDTRDVNGLSSTDFTADWTPPDRRVLEETGASHFCIRVSLISENDKNPGNQDAQENIFDVYSQSPVNDTFLLTNPTDEPRIFYFQLEPKPHSGWEIYLSPAERKEISLVRKDVLRDIKLPALVDIIKPISGKAVSLEAGEKAQIGIKIVPPEMEKEFKSQMYSVTILTLLGDVLVPVGGVTYNVRKKQPSQVRIFEPKVSGDVLFLNGRLTPRIKGARVTLTYTMPNGKKFDRRVNTRADGSFFEKMKIKDPVPGSWSVICTWPGDLVYDEATSSKLKFNAV